MLLVIFLCNRLSIDPDNIAPPTAAALGDFFVLLIMTFIIWIVDSGIIIRLFLIKRRLSFFDTFNMPSVFHSPIPVCFAMVLCVGVAVGPAIAHLRKNISEKCLSADYTTLTHSLCPLFVAICLSR